MRKFFPLAETVNILHSIILFAGDSMKSKENIRKLCSINQLAVQHVHKPLVSLPYNNFFDLLILELLYVLPFDGELLIY